MANTGRPGPKPRGEFEEKRATLTTRITTQTRDKLDAAAKASGRSLSQEIEFRLERSFRDDEWLDGALDNAYGDARNVGVMYLLGRIMRDASVFAGVTGQPDWLDEYGEFDSVVQAIDIALASLKPAVCAETEANRAQRYAAAALLVAGQRDPAQQVGWARQVRAKLGNVGSRLDHKEGGKQ